MDNLWKYDETTILEVLCLLKDIKFLLLHIPTFKQQKFKIQQHRHVFQKQIVLIFIIVLQHIHKDAEIGFSLIFIT